MCKLNQAWDNFGAEMFGESSLLVGGRRAWNLQSS